jgi:hypothetical protein
MSLCWRCAPTLTGAQDADADLMPTLPDDFDPAVVDLEEINEGLADL